MQFSFRMGKLFSVQWKFVLHKKHAYLKFHYWFFPRRRVKLTLLPLGKNVIYIRHLGDNKSGSKSLYDTGQSSDKARVDAGLPNIPDRIAPTFICPVFFFLHPLLHVTISKNILIYCICVESGFWDIIPERWTYCWKAIINTLLWY